jgi:DNA-binding MarR family transcriptional regulator
MLASRSKDGDVSQEPGAAGHSAMCLRLMRLFPRVIREMRRHQDRTTPTAAVPLGPRHVAALEQLRDGPMTVGDLAARLGLTISTVSGILAGLDLAGFIERAPDTADRRRTIVAIAHSQRATAEAWLDGVAAPLARVLARLAADERAAFLKAMDMLEAEFRSGGDDGTPGCPMAGGLVADGLAAGSLAAGEPAVDRLAADGIGGGRADELAGGGGLLRVGHPFRVGFGRAGRADGQPQRELDNERGQGPAGQHVGEPVEVTPHQGEADEEAQDHRCRPGGPPRAPGAVRDQQRGQQVAHRTRGGVAGRERTPATERDRAQPG